jgi:hypothetical protein
MKHLFSMTAFAFVTSTVMIPAVNAQISTNSRTRNNPYIQGIEQQITPFNLVGGAYQGLFQEQGIPKYGTLISAYIEGKVTPEDIVQAAIRANRLQATALQDKGYLNAVKTYLDGLSHR